MTTRQLARFRRGEIAALRELMGTDRVAPGAKEEYRKRIRWCRRELKALVD